MKTMSNNRIILGIKKKSRHNDNNKKATDNNDNKQTIGSDNSNKIANKNGNENIMNNDADNKKAIDNDDNRQTDNDASKNAKTTTTGIDGAKLYSDLILAEYDSDLKLTDEEIKYIHCIEKKLRGQTTFTISLANQVILDKFAPGKKKSEFINKAIRGL